MECSVSVTSILFYLLRYDYIGLTISKNFKSLFRKKRSHLWLLAALLTSCSFGINNTIFKWSNTKGYSKIHIQFFFYISAFFLTLGFSLISGKYHIHLLAIVLGATIGILNAYGNLQMSHAFDNGPASLTSPLIAANTLFPILCAGLIFKEHITLVQWVGILSMLGAALLIQYSPKASKNDHYTLWMLHILLAIFSFGVLGILMQVSSHLHIESVEVLTAMYGGGSAYLLITMIRKKEKVQHSEVKIGAAVSMLSLIGYSCYFYALNTGISSIVFPIVSLNCLVVVFIGCYLYKERLKLYQMAGVAIALIGIILTKI